MSLLAIDPGNYPGFAWFDAVSKELWGCSNCYEAHEAAFCAEIVCERPVIYRHSKADPNKIITLAINAGQRVQAALKDNLDALVTWYEPRQWKGQIPKTKKLKDYNVYKNVKKTLNAFENAELERALSDVSEKECFDIVDAVGIGLYHLQRM